MYDGRPYQVYIKSRSFLNVHHSIGLTHSWCTGYGNHLSNILMCIKRKGGCIYIYCHTASEAEYRPFNRSNSHLAYS